MYTISVIIPAYNEERTIRNVICAVEKVDLIDNVIVISDGSTDKTANIAREFSTVKVVEVQENRGKTESLKLGYELSEDSDIIVFLDADLKGVTPKHIYNLLLPILKDDVDMTIGIFNGGRYFTFLGQMITPFLSGQRALKRDIIERIFKLDISRFGIEMAITEYVSRNNLKVEEVPWTNVTHVLKEEKMGLLKGFRERVRMYIDIILHKKKNRFYMD